MIGLHTTSGARFVSSVSISIYHLGNGVRVSKYTCRIWIWNGQKGTCMFNFSLNANVFGPLRIELKFLL